MAEIALLVICLVIYLASDASSVGLDRKYKVKGEALRL